jgi:hypothetical protein
VFDRYHKIGCIIVRGAYFCPSAVACISDYLGVPTFNMIMGKSLSMRKTSRISNLALVDHVGVPGTDFAFPLADLNGVRLAVASSDQAIRKNTCAHLKDVISMDHQRPSDANANSGNKDIPEREPLMTLSQIMAMNARSQRDSEMSTVRAGVSNNFHNTISGGLGTADKSAPNTARRHLLNSDNLAQLARERESMNANETLISSLRLSEDGDDGYRVADGAHDSNEETLISVSKGAKLPINSKVRTPEPTARIPAERVMDSHANRKKCKSVDDAAGEDVEMSVLLRQPSPSKAAAAASKQPQHLQSDDVPFELNDI